LTHGTHPVCCLRTHRNKPIAFASARAHTHTLCVHPRPTTRPWSPAGHGVPARCFPCCCVRIFRHITVSPALPPCMPTHAHPCALASNAPTQHISRPTATSFPRARAQVTVAHRSMGESPHRLLASCHCTSSPCISLSNTSAQALTRCPLSSPPPHLRTWRAVEISAMRSTTAMVMAVAFATRASATVTLCGDYYGDMAVPAGQDVYLACAVSRRVAMLLPHTSPLHVCWALCGHF